MARLKRAALSKLVVGVSAPSARSNSNSWRVRTTNVARASVRRGTSSDRSDGNISRKSRMLELSGGWAAERGFGSVQCDGSARCCAQAL